MNYLTTETEGDILVIGFRVATLIDRLSISEVAEEWMEQLESSDLRKLIIDFSSLEFLSSDLLGKLVELRTACLVRGVSLKLCSLSKELKNALSLTRLTGQFKTYRTLRSAIECFGADNYVARQEFFSRYASESYAESTFANASAAPALELFPSSNNSRNFKF